MFNKKLEKRITERFEKVVDSLNERVFNLEELNKFLLEHGKNDLVVEPRTDWSFLFSNKYYLDFKFIKCGHLIQKSKQVAEAVCVKDIENLNNGTYIISAVDNASNEDRFYMFDKYAEDIFDITGYKIYNKTKEVKVETNPKKEKKAIDKKVKESKVKPERKKFSKLSRYYDKYKLNLSVKDFKPIHNLDEKDVATLLYLFDNYKYVYEIEKHIDLKKLSIEKYAYWLAKHGYLIYSRGMGRVANGCLIYNKENNND